MSEITSHPDLTPGARLKAARVRLGLTARAAAARAGVSRPVWSATESGAQPATLDQFHKLATAIGADPSGVDPRLARKSRARTLTLLPSRSGELVAFSDADEVLRRELAPVPLRTTATLFRLVQAAADAGVRLVVRTDLPPIE